MRFQIQEKNKIRNKLIIGKSVILESINLEDIEIARNWRNNPKLKRFFRQNNDLTKSEQLSWFYKISNPSNSTEILFKIVESKSKEMLGIAGINYINWVNNNAQLSLYIGKDNLYVDKHGWAKEAACLIIKYAFEKFNVKKIICEVFDYDIAKKKLLEEIDFEHEGTFKSYVYKNGKYINSLFYSKIRK